MSRKGIATEIFQLNLACYAQWNSISLNITLDGLNPPICFTVDWGSGCGGGFECCFVYFKLTTGFHVDLNQITLPSSAHLY